MNSEYFSDKPLQEKCGIVGLYTPRFTRKLPLALLAAGGVQHRGQQGAGIAFETKDGIKRHTGNGLIREIFTPPMVESLNENSRWVIVHCRYGTSGSHNEENLQPCLVKTPDKTIVALVHNGEFVVSKSMKRRIKTHLPDGVSDTYIFALLLAQAKGDSWEEKILTTLSHVKGAYSLIIGVNNALYVARDPNGIRPLMIGQIEDGWLAASETHAFQKVGVKVKREVKKGEVIRIDRDGLATVKNGSAGADHFCDFEWVYFSRPDSLLPTFGNRSMKSWISINTFREKTGKILAQEHPIKNISFVVGTPDSGISMTTSYANTLKVPYRQVVVRDHFDPHGSHRLFMKDDNKEKIAVKVLGKLSVIPDKNIWKNAVVVIGDDSIVRGNVSKKLTKAIFALGAKEVHWIIGFPPVAYRCHLGVSMRTREELVAARLHGDSCRIAKEIGATSVNYISIKGFIQARLSGKLIVPENPKELFLVNGGCGGCVTGIYPISRSGIVYQCPKSGGVFPEKRTKKIAVLVSNAGTGTNLQAIIDAINKNRLRAKIAVVVSDAKDAYGLKRAASNNIPTLVIKKKDNLTNILKEKYHIDYIALAGWRKIIPAKMIKKFKNRIFNIHPGLIPDSVKETVKNPDGTTGLWNQGKFTSDAIKNFFNQKSTFAGSSVHLTTNKLDFGRVLVRCFEKIMPGDTVDSLYGRLKKKENQIYVEALIKVCHKE
jgi:amidophosphoribosyltransferase